MAKKKRQNQPAKKQLSSARQQEEIAHARAEQKELEKYLAECAAHRLARRRHIGIPTARVIIATQKARNTR